MLTRGWWEDKLPFPRNTNGMEKLSTVDLLIKAACFVTKVNNIYNMKSSQAKLASTRRSAVLVLPLQ
jgi:hypothetical protein